MDTHQQSPAVDSAASEQSDRGQKFSMRGTPVLADGAWSKAIATAENLWLTTKVYAGGGENALHTHMAEDHAHIVMQGKAVFHFKDGTTCEVLPFEGVMLPKGTWYRFEAATEENLVMLRVGAAQRKTTGIDKLLKLGAPVELAGTTIDTDGTEKVGRGGKSGKPVSPTVIVPGKTFPAA